MPGSHLNHHLADLVTREPKHAGEHRDVRVQPGPEPRPGTRRQRRERRALTRRAAQPHPRMLEHQRDDRRQLELLIDDRIADPFLAAIKHVPATTAVRQMLKIHVRGKGRKARTTPLKAETATALKAWLHERQGNEPDPLFPTRQGRPLRRKTVSLLVTRHAHTAAANCPSLAAKHISPHTLRHTNAMLLQAEHVDIATIALWLGHESIKTTYVYLQCATRRPVVSPVQPGGTQGRFLGPMANPDPKGDRNNSMPGKMRREALCCIPGAAGMNCSWV